MSTDLPAREYLDEAAKAAGYVEWCYAPTYTARNSILAHARTLEEKAALEARLAKYEPPVDAVTAEVRECLKARFPECAGEIDKGLWDNSDIDTAIRIRISREKEHPLT